MHTFAVFTILLSVTVISCSTKTKTYSCDPEKNQWAIEHLADYETLDRAGLAAIEHPSDQVVVYRMLTPTQQCNIWKEKLAILINDPSYSTAEIEHFETAYNHLSPSDFEDAASLAALKVWAESWLSDASVFGWTEYEEYIACMTWLDDTEVQNYRAIYFGGGGGAGTPEPAQTADCGCYYSISCYMLGKSCIDGSCNTTNGGCGVFGTTNCGGNCQ